MAFESSPRLMVFIFFTVVFYILLSGLLTAVVALPVTAILTCFLHFQRFEQLPQERLRKFASLFSLASGKQNVEHPTGNGLGKEDRRHRIILHRGGCIDAPENTMEAIQEVGFILYNVTLSSPAVSKAPNT